MITVSFDSLQKNQNQRIAGSIYFKYNKELAVFMKEQQWSRGFMVGYLVFQIFENYGHTLQLGLWFRMATMNLKNHLDNY